MPETHASDDPLAARKAACVEYLDTADDRAAALAFLCDTLDPVADSELLSYLESLNTQPTS